MPPTSNQNAEEAAVDSPCGCEAKRRRKSDGKQDRSSRVAASAVSGPLTEEDRYCIDRFRQLVRIPTISGEGNFRVYWVLLQGVPSGSYAKCAELLQKWLGDITGVTNIRAVEYVPGKPVVLATFPGTDPALSTILLNGHYDVVPVFREHWKTEPFEAVIEDGKIYGRGTQDMKCVLTGYIEGLRRIFAQGRQLRRTIHISLVPDEEVGGADGAMKFAESSEFADLNVGMVLDEGLANPSSEKYTVFYGERATNWVAFRVKGNTGHGSRFIDNTAVEKL
ncbi:adenylate cyclase, partial [Perkinsus olseni]